MISVWASLLFLAFADHVTHPQADLSLRGGANGSAASGTCKGGWPLFNSEQELKNEGRWLAYMTQVYWVVPPFKYPFCVGDLMIFYDDKIDQNGVMIPPIAGDCPPHGAPEGRRYRRNNYYQRAGVSFSWHAPPYTALPSHTWAEVTHAADPFGDEHYGMWLLWTPGSGIWLDLGNSIAFSEHSDAFKHFGIQNTTFANEEMSQSAASAGYDSIQFTRHVDHVNYPCDTAAGVKYMGLEIVATRLTGTYACGRPDELHWGDIIQAGWQPGHSQYCGCDEAIGVLNCNGIGGLVDVAAV